MKQRAFINLRLTVDLDSIPGTFHQAEDFVTTISQTLSQMFGHYNPELKQLGEATVLDYRRLGHEYVQPGLQDLLQAKIDEAIEDEQLAEIEENNKSRFTVTATDPVPEALLDAIESDPNYDLGPWEHGNIVG
jgi:hypothetical protein